MSDRMQAAYPDSLMSSSRLADEAVSALLENAQSGKIEMAFNMSVHKRMNNAVLRPELSEEALFAFNYGNISQDAGANTSGKMDHHFCNNQIGKSMRHVDNAEQNIRDSLAKKNLSDEDLLDIVRQLGARMHTLQDFYAHSNYVELNLAKDAGQKPQDLPLMNWQDIRDGRAGDLRTGFYYYKNSAVNELVIKMSREELISALTGQGEKIPGTKYQTDFLYERDREKGFTGALHIANEKRYSVLHQDTAKDNENSDQGKVVNPRTAKSLFEYARNLALRETERQWDQFENTVKELKGAQGGREILDRIKNLRTRVETQRWYREMPEGKATKNAEIIS